MIDFLIPIGKTFSLTLLVIFIIYLAQLIYRTLYKYDLKEELSQGNLAIGVAISGYLFSVLIVVLAACSGETQGFLQDIQSILLYSGIGIFLLLVANLLNDKLILSKFSNTKEIVEDKNVGAAGIMFGNFIASSLVIGGSILGEGGGILTTLTFFALGQLAFLIFAKLYNLITEYDIHKEVEKDNVAAGIAFGGIVIALGIILLKGVSGDFNGWYLDIRNFSIEVITGFITLPIFRMLFDKLLIPHLDLDKEIAKGNISVGFLEASIMILVALTYYFVADLSVGI